MGRVIKLKLIMSWGCAQNISDKTFKNLIRTIWAFSSLVLIMDIIVLALAGKNGTGSTTAGSGVALACFGYLVAGFGTSIATAETKDNATTREAVFIIMALFLSIASFAIICGHIFLLVFVNALTPGILKSGTGLALFWLIELIFTTILCVIAMLTTCYSSCCKWNAVAKANLAQQQRVGTSAVPNKPKLNFHHFHKERRYLD